MDKDTKNFLEGLTWGGTVCGLMGIVMGVVSGRGATGSKLEELRPFQYGSQTVIRANRKMARDNIFVEQGGKYITLRKYLENTKNDYDKQIKEAEIKKIVGW